MLRQQRALSLFQGVKNDVKGKLRCYKHDWISGLRAGFRYINFLSSFAFTKRVHHGLRELRLILDYATF